MGKYSSSSSVSRSPSPARSRSRERRRSRSRSRHGASNRDRDRQRSGSQEEGFRIHVSDLPGNCSRLDLEETFKKFGPLIEVWKTNNPPCFAFVVFWNKEDAEEAIRELNGQYICGSRVRVTMALPRARERQRRTVFNSDARCYQCGQAGHFSRNCRNYEGAGRNRMAPSPRGYNRMSAPRFHRRSSSSPRSRSRSRSRSRRRSRDGRSRDWRRSPDRDRMARRGDSKDSDRRVRNDIDPDDIIAAQGY